MTPIADIDRLAIANTKKRQKIHIFYRNEFLGTLQNTSFLNVVDAMRITTEVNWVSLASGRDTVRLSD